jgi:hypothetical protein
VVVVAGAGQPLGETEVVLDRRALAGLTAGCLPLDDDSAEPLGGGVNRRGQPGRAAADNADVVQRLLGLGADAHGVGEVQRGGRPQVRAVRNEHQGQVVHGRAGQLDQAARLGVPVDLEPRVRDVVAVQERLDLVAADRPAVADDAQAAGAVRVGVPPVREQPVDGREQSLPRRIPGLEQVVVKPDVVDRRDGDVRVRVGGQQQLLGAGRVGLGLAQQLDAGHRGHPLVGDDQGHRLVTQRQPGQRRQSLLAGQGRDDAILGPVLAVESAADRRLDVRVVVDGHDRWPAHRGMPLAPERTIFMINCAGSATFAICGAGGSRRRALGWRAVPPGRASGPSLRVLSRGAETGRRRADTGQDMDSFALKCPEVGSWHV